MLSICEGLRLPTTFLGQTAAALGTAGGLLGLVALSGGGHPSEGGVDPQMVTTTHTVTNNYIHPSGPPAINTSYVDPQSSWDYDGHDSRSVAHISPNAHYDQSRYVAINHPDGSGRDLIPLRHK